MEEIIAQYDAAKAQVEKLKDQLSSYDDGFIYLIKKMRYRSVSWYYYRNTWCIKQAIHRCAGGDEGLIEIWTDNPEFKRPKNEGAIRRFCFVSTEKLMKKVTTNNAWG